MTAAVASPQGERWQRSAAATDGVVTSTAEVRSWLASRAEDAALAVRRVRFDAMAQWGFDPRTGDLRHASGRFFTVEGLHVRSADTGAGWRQPIIVQPEVGVLGLLAREFDGVLHVLVQAKAEPGNAGGRHQLSPTVQATRSNCARVHRGRRVAHLDAVLDRTRNRVLADVLQSEQGSWFLHKRNRNLVVETTADVPADGAFRWLTLGQLGRLLLADDLVNMDLRTVLATLLAAAGPEPDLTGVLGWLTAVRAGDDQVRRAVPLAAVSGPDGGADGGDWRRTADAIAHRDGRYFEIVAVDVRAAGREVAGWSQPLLAPCEPGVVAFLTRRAGGTPEVLVHARAEAGSLNGAELAPSVQCQPGSHRHLPAAAQPPYLDLVLGAPPARIRYDAVLSEEGGRFLEARNRYVVVDAPDLPEPPATHRWLSLDRLGALVARGGHVNVQARSLYAAVRATGCLA